MAQQDNKQTAADKPQEPTQRQKEDLVARLFRDDPQKAAQLLRTLLGQYPDGK